MSGYTAEALTPAHPPTRLTVVSVGHLRDNVRKARILLRGWARDVAGYDEDQERRLMRSVRMAPSQPSDPYDFRLMGEMPGGVSFTTTIYIP